MIGAMVRAPHQPLPVTAGPELFDALGGRATVGMIVDDLYDRLERDKELSRLFRSRRPGERDRLKEFFEGRFDAVGTLIRMLNQDERGWFADSGELAAWMREHPDEVPPSLTTSTRPPPGSEDRPGHRPGRSDGILIAAGSPLVVFVLAGAVFWLIDARRYHCPGISG
jgi:hypothetical protein